MLLHKEIKIIYLMIFLAFFIFSDYNPFLHVDEDVVSDLKINVESGSYEQYMQQTWGMKGTDCIELKIIQPHFGTKWMPAASIVYDTDDNSKFAKIFLHGDINNKRTLTLKYSAGEKPNITHSVIKEGIRYGEPIKLEISYPNASTIKIYFDGQEYIKELNFTPTKFSMGVSSSVSEIKSLSSGGCMK